MSAKIVATIGPKTADPESLRALHAAGMGMARLNGSHADLAWHAETIRLIRTTLPEIPILLDIPGRKIRTALLANPPSFRTGDVIVLTGRPGHDGSDKVSVSYERLHEDLQAGNVILADDGTLRFTVVEIRGHDILCRADVDGTLKSRKGINVPYVSLRTALVTERDRTMTAFAREQGIDYVGISFVESAAHVTGIRALIGAPWPGIVAKVENQGGLENVDEICAAADAIMIDRGDLSVETRLETMALAQKRIIRAARQAAKPVIVATEMLHTMIDNPFPTKAEVSDITNAVLDGCAATMLSGETAVGRFPVEAVTMMRTISDAAAHHYQAEMDLGTPADGFSIPGAIDEAIALICRRVPVTKIVAVTKSGYAARRISSRLPRQPILAVTNEESAARSFNLLYGTLGVHVDVPFEKAGTGHIPVCLESLWRRGLIVADDLIVVTAATYPKSGNRMNLIQLHRVSDLAEVMGW